MLRSNGSLPPLWASSSSRSRDSTRLGLLGHRFTNWGEYHAALRQRGSLTVWFTEAAIAAWRAEPRTTPAANRTTRHWRS